MARKAQKEILAGAGRVTIMLKQVKAEAVEGEAGMEVVVAAVAEEAGLVEGEAQRVQDFGADEEVSRRVGQTILGSALRSRYSWRGCRKGRKYRSWYSTSAQSDLLRRTG